MKTNTDQETGWEFQFEPYTEHKVPSGFVLRTEVTSFWNKIFHTPAEDDHPEPAAGDLERLSDRNLERVVPEIQSDKWYQALDKLTEVFTDQRKRGPLVIVTQPYSMLTSVIKSWAEQRNRQLVSAPELSGDLANSSNNLLPGSDWIIPDLRSWFERSPDGLQNIRALLSYIQAAASTRGIVVCSSWAWNYLDKAVGLKTFDTRAYTLRSLDAEALAGYLLGYAERATGREVEFCNSTNGKYVLHRQTDPQDRDKKEVQFNDLIEQLASYSRGNMTLAFRFWSNCLRTEPDTDIEESKQQEKMGNGTLTYWVIPWSEQDLPVVPAGFNWLQNTILHTLIIHGSLDTAQFSRLLPHTEDERNRAFADLEQHELVETRNDRYRVAMEAYPAVRQHLAQNGFLTDKF
ncbi:MAG: hypothetical protein R3281_06935 [Balneolaceae bacterium]|nr:hypothetical protein [Balneolaceae bacterium]